jgi:hypothetical protein
VSLWAGDHRSTLINEIIVYSRTGVLQMIQLLLNDKQLIFNDFITKCRCLTTVRTLTFRLFIIINDLSCQFDIAFVTYYMIIGAFEHGGFLTFHTYNTLILLLANLAFLNNIDFFIYRDRLIHDTTRACWVFINGFCW